MKGERSGMATPRNPMPRAAIAEIDEAMMALATAQRDVMKLSQTNDPGVLSIIVRLLHTLHEAEKSLIAAKGGAPKLAPYQLISNVQHLADNPVRIRFSGSGYQAADRQDKRFFMAAAWWEHALIDLQNGRREAEKTNYSRRFEKRTATGFKSRPPNFVKLACQA